MEAYYGGTLEKRMEEKTRFSILDCLEVTKRILVAVDYIHSLGMMHRDIKPHNIMFKDEDKSYDLAVIDFGFATLEEEYSTLFKMCGTLGYQAPEIIEGKDYGKKVDMFAVGVVVYQMITGIPPFFKVGDSRETVNNKIRSLNYSLNWKSMELNYTPEQQFLISDFLKKLLTYHPKDRLSAKEALEHKVFSLTKSKQSSVEQKKSQNQDLKFSFEKNKKFKDIGTGLMYSQISQLKPQSEQDATEDPLNSIEKSYIFGLPKPKGIQQSNKLN